MRSKVVELEEAGVVVRSGRLGEFVIPYKDILTTERLRSGRALDLHTRGQMEPVRVRCRRSRRGVIESGLRFMGVRIVDCWGGAIIAPTLLDFEEELAREPVRVRQSSDDA